MQRWGPIWRVLIRPALACFTARFRSLHPRARTSSTKSWDPMFVQMSTRRARNQMLYVILWGQSTHLERRGSSLHFRRMGGNYRTHYRRACEQECYQAFCDTVASVGFCRFQTSLTGVCEGAVKAACVDVYGCVPPGSSSAGLIIRSDRWRGLMLIGVFDYYCIKVSTDTCSSRHGNGAAQQAEWVGTATEKF